MMLFIGVVVSLMGLMMFLMVIPDVLSSGFDDVFEVIGDGFCRNYDVSSYGCGIFFSSGFMIVFFLGFDGVFIVVYFMCLWV